MSTKKVNLRDVRVEYVKGKYTYKNRKNILSEIAKILFSGTVSSLRKDPESISTLYDNERSNGRISKPSRDAIKGLQMNLSNPKVIESKGVTHIIVYECLNT